MLSRPPHSWMSGSPAASAHPGSAGGKGHACAAQVRWRFEVAPGDRVTVVVIPNAGYALPEEQPQAISEAIAAFARAL